jgi:type IV pilus assembly protein PilC
MAIQLSASDKLNLISNLETMLTAGIPLLDTVETMIDEVKGGQKKILEVLKEDINQGKKISESFAKFPHAFDPVIIHLLEAAEQAGTLDETLKDLIITIKKDIEFNNKVKSALFYPGVVFGVFILISVMILVFVIPRISEVFLSLRVPLPLPTRILIASSRIFLKYMPLVIGGIIGGIALLIYFYKNNRKTLFNVFFSLPFFNNLAKEIDLTRFTRAMALLLNSGIPIARALELASQVAVKKEIVEMLKDAQETVNSGKNLSDSFKKYQKHLPGLMIRVTQAGEKTGSLSKSMQDLAEYFDERVSNIVKTMTALLEPMMLVLMGGLVGGMMLAIIAPIYGLIGQIQAH